VTNEDEDLERHVAGVSTAGAFAAHEQRDIGLARLLSIDALTAFGTLERFVLRDLFSRHGR